jgi:hypothetical protein
MTEQFANAAQSTLAGAISNVATTLTVASAAAFPTTGTFRIIVDSEIMLVTGVAGAVFTVTRGAEGTAAAAHASGATVTGIITAGALTQLKADARANIAAGSIVAAGSSGEPQYNGGGVISTPGNITMGSGFMSLGAAAASVGSLRLGGTAGVFQHIAWWDGTANRDVLRTFSGALLFGDDTGATQLRGATVTLLQSNGLDALKVNGTTDIRSSLPITGDPAYPSPYAGLNGSAPKTLTAAQTYDLLPADYAMSSLEFVSNGANIVRLPAVTTANGTYFKYVQNVSGGGTITVKDVNNVASAAAALTSGQGAWFRVSTGAVKQVTAAFTVA